jgi:hypothetical protein
LPDEVAFYFTLKRPSESARLRCEVTSQHDEICGIGSRKPLP